MPHPNTLEARKLQDQVDSDVLRSLSLTTRKTYFTAWKKFKHFIHQHFTIRFHHISKDHVSMYVSHLHNQHYKASSIKSQLSAIGFIFESSGLDNPTKSFKIQKQLSFYQRTDRQPPIRKPITRDILFKIIRAVKQVFNTKYDRSLYIALFTTMYHAALRVSEVCTSPTNKHNLLNHQIRLIRNHGHTNLEISFKTYKHMHHPSPPLLLQPTKEIDCPVKSYSSYHKLRGNRLGAAFQDFHGSPITRTNLLSALNYCITLAGLSQDEYNTHSFRIGKTTDLAQQGYSYPEISLIGRWKSNAFIRYIKPTTIQTS